MNLYRNILTLFALLLLVSCRDLSMGVGGDRVVVSVGDKELRESVLVRAIPQGLSPEDSLSFVVRHIDRWIKNSVKLCEAERLFFASAHDVEAMVEEYRNSLMIRKLDRYIIGERYKTPTFEAEIEEYYKDNSNIFKLTTNLVKGRILTMPKGHGMAEKMRKEMDDLGGDPKSDFKSMCSKLGFELMEFNAEWMDYQDFLNLLPLVRKGSNLGYLNKRDVQSTEDAEKLYYFQITDAKRAGDIEPLERVEDKILYILNNKSQSEFLNRYEAELLQEATQRGVINNSLEEKGGRE